MYSIILVGFNRFLLVNACILKRNQWFSVSKYQKYVFVKNKTLGAKDLFEVLESIMNSNIENISKNYLFVRYKYWST